MMTSADFPDDGDDELRSVRTPMSPAAKLWVGAGLLALIVVTAWVSWNIADQPVRWRDVGFDVHSPTSASATFDVFLYTDQPVICHLRAMNRQFAEVGIGVQLVDPAAGREQRFTTEMATVEEATTAVVRYCETMDS